MRFIFPILIVLLPGACKTLQISNELDDQTAFRLYKQTLNGANELSLHYNTDSTYVVCLEKGTTEEFAPVSFVVVNIAGRSEILASQNTYLGIAWIHRNILRLEKRIGINLESTDPSKPASNSKYDYFDVEKKEFLVFNNSNKATK